MRQARIPSLSALNPEIDAELEAIVRKALARDPDDRYQNAGDLGEALSQYLFSHRMKVTARDITTLVRDAQVEMMRKRSAEPKESLIDALILDEMQKMASLIAGEEEANKQTAGDKGSMSLDPSAFVDTSGWANEMNQPQKRQTRPPPNKSKSVTTPPPNDIESLEQMLEPDRTGLHKRDNKPPWAIIIFIMVLVSAGATVAIIFAMQS